MIPPLELTIVLGVHSPHAAEKNSQCHVHDPAMESRDNNEILNTPPPLCGRGVVIKTIDHHCMLTLTDGVVVWSYCFPYHLIDGGTVSQVTCWVKVLLPISSV